MDLGVDPSIDDALELITDDPLELIDYHPSELGFDDAIKLGSDGDGDQFRNQQAEAFSKPFVQNFLDAFLHLVLELFGLKVVLDLTLQLRAKVGLQARSEPVCQLLDQRVR